MAVVKGVSEGSILRKIDGRLVAVDRLRVQQLT